MSDEPIIVETPRGPSIRGTRITVYDILDYHTQGDHHTYIALVLGLSSWQVLGAIEYIEQHRDEVMVEYQKILARIARGNTPEAQAKADAAHAAFQAKLRAKRERLEKEGPGARAAG